MSKVSIIIPVHGIRRRGFKRVLYSVWSLMPQMDYIEEIIIVDSSEKIDNDELRHVLSSTPVNIIHTPQHCFNKPYLLNTGIKAAKSKWIMCTDADYIFRKDFFYTCEQLRGEKKMLHKQVKMLPNMNINRARIETWNFPKCGYNIWGTLANGACQYATREFFMANPYPEEMDGFSAFDNLMTYMAYNNGLEIHWINESEILHQHHTIENKMAGANRAKFERNQTMLQAYINKYNLPCLLHK